MADSPLKPPVPPASTPNVPPTQPSSSQVVPPNTSVLVTPPSSLTPTPVSAPSPLAEPSRPVSAPQPPRQNQNPVDGQQRPPQAPRPPQQNQNPHQGQPNRDQQQRPQGSRPQEQKSNQQGGQRDNRPQTPRPPRPPQQNQNANQGQPNRDQQRPLQGPRLPQQNSNQQGGQRDNRSQTPRPPRQNDGAQGLRPPQQNVNVRSPQPPQQNPVPKSPAPPTSSVPPMPVSPAPTPVPSMGMPTPTPVEPPKPPAPVAPKPIPAAPVLAPQETAPQFTSRILQGASSMSALPFQAPPLGNTPVTAQHLSSAPQTQPIIPQQSGLGSSVPQESMAMKSAGGGVPPQKPTGTPNAFFEALKNPKLLIAGLVIILLVVVGIFAMNFLGGTTPNTPSTQRSTTKNVELTYWGLWEPPEVMQSLIDQYESANPGVNITYVQQRSDQYRQRLQAAIRDGSGPDLFRYHNTWMPMIREDLAPAGRTFTAEEMQANYYPIMSAELVSNDQVVGAPLMIDGLALIYNESMLAAANALPPRDWEQVRILADQLAVESGGTLERGGIALGNAVNVDNYSDILGLMMLQNGANPGNPVTPKEAEALTFYTLFTRTDNVWNDTFPNSTQAFANEKVAMIIVPSWRIFEIQQMNPNLKFGVTRVPQLGGDDVTWASYWVEGVSKTSQNTEEAWKFLAFLSQPEQLRSFQTQATSVRGFGELYPRVDMAAELKTNPLLAPYLDDALLAKSWYMASMTHDEGLNDKMIQYYTDAVNDVNARGSAEQALQTILPGVQQVMSQYGVSAGTGSLSTP